MRESVSERKKENKEIDALRSFLISRSLIIVAAVSAAEILASVFVTTILSAVASGFADGPVRISLQKDLLPVIGILLLQLLGKTVPVLTFLTESGISGLENNIIANLPQSMIRQILRMPWYLQLMVLILFLMLFLLYLLPVVIGSVCFILMVQKKMQELEEQQRRIYENFEKQRSLMLADIAHDLRNPITAVYGYAQALTDGMITDPDQQKEYLDVIRAKSGRINDLIQLLFDYTKLDSPGFTLNKTDMELCELLRENAALIYPDMEKAGLIMEADIPEQIFMVSVDRMQVSRVITNLLTNAIRHNVPGTKVLLRMTISGKGAVIDVADNGGVISPELAAHLFEPFAMGDKSRNSGGGSGLGLAIAFKIAQMHGWDLSCQSDMEGYTKSFRIRIPQGMDESD